MVNVNGVIIAQRSVHVASSRAFVTSTQQCGDALVEDESAFKTEDADDEPVDAPNLTPAHAHDPYSNDFECDADLALITIRLNPKAKKTGDRTSTKRCACPRNAKTACALPHLNKVDERLAR